MRRTTVAIVATVFLAALLAAEFPLSALLPAQPAWSFSIILAGVAVLLFPDGRLALYRLTL